RPLSNVQVYVLDAQRQLLPFGVAGELYIAGDGLARGYLNRQALTAERFVANPYGPPGSRMYRTGDLVRWLPDGQLAFIGRIDQQLKLRGQRVELGEIEVSLQRHPAVRDAVVVAHTDRDGEGSLVGYVVPRGAAPAISELREYLRSWLPQHMIPATFVILETLPLNRSGKVDRGALPPPPGQAIAAGEPAYMPPIEEIVADAFKQAIGCEHVGADDNFFDLGGHSLLTMRVAAELERLLAQPISPAWIFQAPTAAQLGRLLDTKLVAASSHVTPLQPLGDRPPLFCMHDLVSRPLSYVSLARLMAPDQPVYGLAPGPLEARFIAKPSLRLLTQAYLQAIKEIQPSGPYRIVGYSFGGVPAFDLACALEARGEQVQLILIDSFVKRRLPGPLQMARWIARYRGRALRELYWARDRLLKRRGTIRETEIPDWVPASSRPLARALLQAQETNRYEPFRGSTVFLESASREPVQELFNLDGINGWRGLVGGPLLRLKLEAEHFWMMRDPLVSEIASILRTC
ncbi:MAG: AMP-binding protein, partial [Acetobacteraceae bacterium]|nr:AMP-binding protein [Acetobacteraceae bacterium]